MVSMDDFNILMKKTNGGRIQRRLLVRVYVCVCGMHASEGSSINNSRSDVACRLRSMA